MGKLIYATPLSLDGYLGDGDYEWSDPGEEGHAFFAEITAPIGTYLYGRRMYETMRVWEDPENFPGADQDMLDFATVWKAADKIVFSRTLDKVSTSKTRLVREFDPKMIRELKLKSTKDITISGSTLAAEALRLGLIDEIQLFIVPKMIGGGIPVFPKGVQVNLELQEERRFGDGWVFLRYRSII